MRVPPGRSTRRNSATPGRGIRQVLDQLAREHRVEGPVAKGQGLRVTDQEAHVLELGLTRAHEVVVDVRGHDREGPVGPDLGEQAPPATRVEHAPAARNVLEEERLEPAQHRRVQLEEERLDRGVTVAGVDPVVVGAQHLGVGHSSRHEPVLDHRPSRRSTSWMPITGSNT